MSLTKIVYVAMLIGSMLITLTIAVSYRKDSLSK